MKQVSLAFGEVPLLYYFLVLVAQDYLVFTLKTVSNFRQAPFVIGSLKSLLFRYYILLMILVTTGVLVKRLYEGKFGYYETAAYSITRIYAYMFLIINAINEWHRTYTDELVSLSTKRWTSVLTVFEVVLFIVNCKLTFQFHNSVDDESEVEEGTKD